MAKKLKTLPVAKQSTDYPMAVNPAKVSEADKKKMEDRERRYRAEDALRDIERAEQHKTNKQLMSDVKTLAREKVTALDKVCKSK
jgi:hypothetical protein